MPPASILRLLPASVSPFDATNGMSLSLRAVRSGRGRLRQAEVGGADARVGGERARRTADHDAPGLQDVGAGSQGQRAARVLLDEQDGHALGVEAGDDV